MKQTFKALFFICIIIFIQLSGIHTYAQSNNYSVLIGSWVPDKIAVIEIKGTDSVLMDAESWRKNPFFAIFSELTINADTTIRLINNDYEYDSEGPFLINKNEIEIPFTGAAYNLKYSIKDDFLFLQQNLEPDETPLNKKIQLQSTYTRKP